MGALPDMPTLEARLGAVRSRIPRLRGKTRMSLMGLQAELAGLTLRMGVVLQRLGEGLA